MDLLAGYGSGSESEDDAGPIHALFRPNAAAAGISMHSDPTTEPAAAKSAGLFSRLPRPQNAAPERDSNKNGLPAGFFDPIPAHNGTSPPKQPAGLPAGFFDAPSTADRDAAGGNAHSGPPRPHAATTAAADKPGQPAAAQLPAQLSFSKLPAASKRKVVLRPQIDMQLLAQESDSDDDTPAAKRVKQAAPAAAGKPSVLSFLPAPKNTAHTGARMDLGSASLGAGSSTSGPKAKHQHARQQPYQDEDADADAAAAAGPTAPAAGNEAYRLRPAAAAANTGGPGASAQYDEQYYEQYQQQHSYEAHPQHYAAPAPSAAAAAMQQYEQLPPEQAFLQEALQAEAAKAARRAAGGGSSQLVLPDIQFKEVKADTIKYVDPAQREAAQGMRSALGSDYAATLRAQAAPHTGSRVARQKHQIGTLFANAKLRELEVLENRASGMKSKAETAGKYGW